MHRLKSARSALATLAVAIAVACGPGTEADLGDAPTGDDAAAPARLGSMDGLDLPGWAPTRIAAGDPAPDFRLESYRGDTLALSDFRGKREILLVFYRGAW